MAYLFLDTSYDITLGLLNNELAWLEFAKFEGQKASRILQLETNNFLTKHSLSPKDIQGIFLVAGPGFYTGLRVSEGFADVFNFFQIPSWSFYSFEIPLLCGIAKGCWFTKAYRGEYFLSRWNQNSFAQENIPQGKVAEALSGLDNVFIHSTSALDEFSLNLIQNHQTTQSLLKDRAKDIFQGILDHKLKRESFYFRAPEDEFKANP